MNDLNPSRTSAARVRVGGLLNLFLLAGLLAVAVPLRAQNSPPYVFQIEPAAVPGGFAPLGLAVDSSGNLYVTDGNSNRVIKFTALGTYLTQWGTYGSGNGKFSQPRGIAVDSSNNVYVVDAYNSRVEKFDSNGNYLTQWGMIGSGNGEFSQYPNSVAVDSSNNVYVADSNNDRVEKFDSNGNYLTQWGSEGSGNSQFGYDGPTGIAVDGSNNVYVIDPGNFRIAKFDSNGNYLMQISALVNDVAEAIAVDASNNVYVTYSYYEAIIEYDSNGNYLTQWGGPGSGTGQIGNPTGIVVDNHGNFIYVASYSNGYLIQAYVINTNLGPALISSQPASQSVLEGANVTLSVGVVGAAPYFCQWSSNNIALPGATNASLALNNVSPADAGNYTVLVTNNLGSALSSNAVLAVLAVPALVKTLPASSLSSTGAVLNGSFSVGSDPTIAWFEWGTDTNYGNIAGETVVPGNNGSNNISSTLSGLSGNIYHYRIDATNYFGIVYGNDQSFMVGFAPTVTTLAAANSTNGSTLEATANPNGWDTKVYFKWGPSFSSPEFGIQSSLTNLTPVMDVGAGVAPLNVSSLLTGLAPYKGYAFEAVASNHLGQVPGATIYFASSPLTSAPLGQWNSVASSADGTKLMAISRGGSVGIYISTNSGDVWANNGPNASVGASSADGTKLVVLGGYGYTSTNSGTNWTQQTNAPLEGWSSVASSADGTKLAAVSSYFGVFASINSGINWTYHTNGLLPYVALDSIASSADGIRLVAVSGLSGNGSIYTSTNSGANWTEQTNAPLKTWSSVASSADGTKLAAAAMAGSVYLSTNAGANWSPTSLPTNNWKSVAESADGTKMVALANSESLIFGTGNGGIWTSIDSGNTWISNNVPSASWTCAAMSADGNEFIAVMGSPSSFGGIYVSQTTPAPVLSLAPVNGQPAVSWMIPSLDFTLQQSPDLMSWTDMTNLPVLNLTNLQNQVALPQSDGNSFFRLMH